MEAAEGTAEHPAWKMSSTVGLYYPYIHFRDDGWMKLAALYWDRMARIVPEGYDTRDSQVVQQLQDKLDFVWNEVPGAETAVVGRQFIDVLHQHQAPLLELYGLHRMAEWPVDMRTTERAPWRHKQLAYIYNPKIWADLTGRLVVMGLAQSQWDGSNERIGMHPKLANVYMAALAAEMARQRHLSPVTDDPLCHLAAGGWTMERLAAVLLDDDRFVMVAGRSLDSVEEGLAHIALEAVVPANLEDVSLDKIIEARKELQEQRLAFQDRVRRIVMADTWLQDVDDPLTYQRQLELVYENELKPHLDRMEKDMTLLGIPARRGLFSVLGKAPAFAVDAAKTLGWVINPAISVAAMIVGAILPRVGPKSQTPTQDDNHELLYMLDLKDRFSPQHLSKRLMDRANRAVVGGLIAADQG